MIRVGTISVLYGLTHGIITKDQYSVLVVPVIRPKNGRRCLRKKEGRAMFKRILVAYDGSDGAKFALRHETAE